MPGDDPTAVHLPRGDRPSSGRSTAPGSGVPAVCASGDCANSATAQLVALCVDAWNVAGGMGDWQVSGGVVVDAQGAPGRVA